MMKGISPVVTPRAERSEGRGPRPSPRSARGGTGGTKKEAWRRSRHASFYGNDPLKGRWGGAVPGGRRRHPPRVRWSPNRGCNTSRPTSGQGRPGGTVHCRTAGAVNPPHSPRKSIARRSGSVPGSSAGLTPTLPVFPPLQSRAGNSLVGRTGCTGFTLGLPARLGRLGGGLRFRRLFAVGFALLVVRGLGRVGFGLRAGLVRLA